MNSHDLLVNSPLLLVNSRGLLVSSAFTREFGHYIQLVHLFA
ncbi:hypothetical protein P4576_14335 [Peribacillus frigoritolerans]|nr:hypothetical protein [Peribacillus frigoritolerans]